jgi:zinc/manganese transport system permease protein
MPHAILHFVELLGLPFLACTVMTAILGYLGIHVLSREIVFVDIALAQIVAVGAIGAHLAFGVEEHSALTYAASFALALGAAAFYALARRHVTQISQEAVIGVSYAIAAAAALFLIGIAPGGHVHAQHMLAGSILWASRGDVVACTVVFAAVGICFYVLRCPFQRISSDYDGAVRQGVRVVAWDFLFYALLGVVITFAVRIGGVVVVFSLLIIPATISAIFTSSLGRRLLITWGSGILGAFLGLLFADRLDFSVGPAVGLFLGVELVLAGLWRRRHPFTAGAVTAAAGAVYIALVGGAAAGGGGPGGVGGPSAFGPVEAVAAEAADAGPPSHHEPPPVDNGPPTSSRDLAVLFDDAPDTETRRDVVLRALELEPRCGVHLALRYLGGDPPLFFRQSVIDGLDHLAGEPLGMDVMLPSSDPANLESAERLRKERGLDLPPPPCAP